jgi:hypothetical protein
MAEDAADVNDWVQAVYRFLNHYHQGKVPGGPVDDSSTLRDLAAYAPYVLEKITSNLDIHARYLREQCVRR